MGWLSISGGKQTADTTQTQNSYGTRTPLIGDQFNAAFDAYKNSMGANGANAPQQQSINWQQWALGPDNPTRNGITGQRANIDAISSGFTGVDNQYQGIANQGPYSATAYTASPVSAGAAGSSGGYTGADFANQYAGLYGSQVTDPALRAYDYGTSRAVNDLNAKTAAGGAFANSRASEIPYSDMYAQAALGRGQLSANLNQQGLTNALGFAQGDASRLTQNNQFNTGQSNQMAQFNAGLAQNTNQFNAGQNQQNSQFNVGSANQNTQNRLAALGGAASTLQNQAGLSNQIVQNLVTANGIDTQAAQNLFQSGAITQAQLQSVLDAASQYNGYSYTDNKTGTGHMSGSNFGAQFSPSMSDMFGGK